MNVFPRHSRNCTYKMPPVDHRCQNKLYYDYTLLWIIIAEAQPIHIRIETERFFLFLQLCESTALYTVRNVIVWSLHLFWYEWYLWSSISHVIFWINPTTFLKSSLIKLLVRPGVSLSSGKSAKHAGFFFVRSLIFVCNCLKGSYLQSTVRSKSQQILGVAMYERFPESKFFKKINKSWI